MQFVLDERTHDCSTLNVKGSGFLCLKGGQSSVNLIGLSFFLSFYVSSFCFSLMRCRSVMVLALASKKARILWRDT